MLAKKTFAIHEWQKEALDRLSSFDPGESPGKIVQAGIEFVLQRMEREGLTALEIWVDLLKTPSSYAKREKERALEAMKREGFPYAELYGKKQIVLDPK